MVVNGCLLDEAYGESFVKQKKKKEKKNKHNHLIEIDKHFQNSSNTIHANEGGHEMFYPINENYYIREKNKEENTKANTHHQLNKEKINTNTNANANANTNANTNANNSEYSRLIHDKDYKDYLDFQRNRHNQIHQKNVIESFSNINDNFNDVLLFGLYGIFFLIYTDYIYKLGKRSY